MVDAIEDDDKKKKPPKELFRELLRFYPRAQVDDYFKNGAWLVEEMIIDTVLLEAHRKEAGAPDPPALSEVKLPPLPAEKVPLAKGAALAKPGGVIAAIAPKAGLLGGIAAAKPNGQLAKALSTPAKLGQGAVQPTKAAAQPLLKKPLGKPAGVGAVAPKLGTAAPSATSPATELRQIALFIAKWKLDATKAKLLLARLTPPRRKWVMAQYSGAQTLEAYIQQCDKTNAWAGAADSEPAAGEAGTAAAQGMKRPVSGEAPDPKRPKFGVPAAKFGVPSSMGPKQPSGPPPKALGSLAPATKAGGLALAAESAAKAKAAAALAKAKAAAAVAKAKAKAAAGAAAYGAYGSGAYGGGAYGGGAYGGAADYYGGGGEWGGGGAYDDGWGGAGAYGGAYGAASVGAYGAKGAGAYGGGCVKGAAGAAGKGAGAGKGGAGKPGGTLIKSLLQRA